MNRIATMFSTFDRASETYSPPFAAPHAGVAIRGFTDAINNPARDSDISNHPDDFDLFEVGTFDSSSGLLTPHPEGKSLLVQGKHIALSRSTNSVN